MPLFLKAGGEVVGELGPAPSEANAEKPFWPLYPTAAFERIRPLVHEFEAATSNQDLQRWNTALEQLLAAGLTIVDEAGAALPFIFVHIQKWPDVEPEPSERVILEQLGFRGGPPYYTVAGARPRTPTGDELP